MIKKEENNLLRDIILGMFCATGVKYVANVLSFYLYNLFSKTTGIYEHVLYNFLLVNPIIVLIFGVLLWRSIRISNVFSWSLLVLILLNILVSLSYGIYYIR